MSLRKPSGSCCMTRTAALALRRASCTEWHSSLPLLSMSAVMAVRRRNSVLLTSKPHLPVTDLCGEGVGLRRRSWVDTHPTMLGSRRHCSLSSKITIKTVVFVFPFFLQICYQLFLGSQLPLQGFASRGLHSQVS
jgi:hypothetical protein